MKSKPKFKKRYIPLIAVGVAFLFFGIKSISVAINNNKNNLPYKDSQETIPANNVSNSTMFIDCAKSSYTYLLKQIKLNASNLGVELTAKHKLSLLAYDSMANCLDVVITGPNENIVIKYDCTLEKLQQALQINTWKQNDYFELTEQITELTILLSKSTVIKQPKIQTFNNQLTTTFASEGISYFANSDVNVSYAHERTSQSNTFQQNEDYIYFNLYGTETSNQDLYNCCTTVAIKKTDYEILEQPNLIEYVLQNPTSDKLIISTISQKENSFYYSINEMINDINTNNNDNNNEDNNLIN